MSRYYRIEFEGGVVVTVTKTVADADPVKAAKVALGTARKRQAYLGKRREPLVTTEDLLRNAG